jgi:hypothetical protein
VQNAFLIQGECLKCNYGQYYVSGECIKTVLTASTCSKYGCTSCPKKMDLIDGNQCVCQNPILCQCLRLVCRCPIGTYQHQHQIANASHCPARCADCSYANSRQYPALSAQPLEPASTTPPTTAHAFPITNKWDPTYPTVAAFIAPRAASDGLHILPPGSRHTASLTESAELQHARVIWCNPTPPLSPVLCPDGFFMYCG